MSIALPEGASRAQPARGHGAYRPHWPSVAAFSAAVIASIALAPRVSSGSIFAAFAWRVYADGSITTGVTDVTRVAVAGGILLSGAWLGITVASDLIALRAARTQRRDTAAPRVEAAAAH